MPRAQDAQEWPAYAGMTNLDQRSTEISPDSSARMRGSSVSIELERVSDGPPRSRGRRNVESSAPKVIPDSSGPSPG